MTMVPIKSYTVVGNSTNAFFFDGIPQTYKHLQIRTTHGIYVSSSTGSGAFYIYGINGTALTISHQIYGNGTNYYTTTDSNMPVAYSNFGPFPTMGASVMDIYDYSSTVKTKTIKAISGHEYYGAGTVGIMGLLWNNTAAMTSIGFSAGGGNFYDGTRFDLYGIVG